MVKCCQDTLYYLNKARANFPHDKLMFVPVAKAMAVSHRLDVPYFRAVLLDWMQEIEEATVIILATSQRSVACILPTTVHLLDGPAKDIFVPLRHYGL